MIILKDILYKVAIEAIKGSTDIAVEKMDFDSRKIAKNDVFVAIRGTVSDGHDFIEKAINKVPLQLFAILFQRILLTELLMFK